jgi:type I restriction enzyme S subunit
MDALPLNWSLVKIGDVCKTTSGGTPSRKNPKYYDGKIPWVKSGELNFNTIRDSEEKITAEAIENSNAKLLEKGTLLIALYGATVGRLAFLGIEAATNQAVAAIFTPKNLSSKFLYWFLFSYREKLLNQRIGGAQPNISQGTLRNIPIPLPPLPVQKKIVEKLEELFSGLDSGVASLKKAKEQLRLYRQSVLASAFSGRLHQDSTDYKINRIKEKKKSNQSKNPVNPNPANPQILTNPGSDNLPDGWKWVKIREVAEIINGYAFKSGDFKSEGKYQVIKIGNVRPGNLRLEERPTFVDDVDEKVLNRSILKENDLIISLTGTRKKRDYGYVAMVTCQKNLLLNQRLAIIRLTKEYNSKFFFYLLRMDLFLDQFFKNETGNVGQGNVGIGGIKDSVLAVPSLSEQTLIVEEIERRFSEADNLEKAIDDSLTKAETLRQSILKQAFEGRLV